MLGACSVFCIPCITITQSKEFYFHLDNGLCICSLKIQKKTRLEVMFLKYTGVLGIQSSVCSAV